jgi:AraC-like DNA-binding protein
MDALSAILRSLRLKSAMLSRAHLSGRWGVHTTGIPRVMIFHCVVAGRCFVRRDAEGNADARELVAGDIVMLARGDGHKLTSEPRGEVVPIRQIPMRLAGRVPLLEVGTKGAAETRLLCGTFVLDHPAQGSIVDLLPPLLVAKPDSEARRRWAEATISLLEQELLDDKATTEVTSLADSLLVYVLNASARQEGLDQRHEGLLAATRDEQIAPALALIHGDKTHNLTVAALAARVGMSRTRFFERFTDLVGEPPARYIARWRVYVAADLLRRKTLGTAEIAQRVGYSSEDALSKVFKRYLGVSPGEYRRAQASGTN